MSKYDPNPIKTILEEEVSHHIRRKAREFVENDEELNTALEQVFITEIDELVDSIIDHYGENIDEAVKGEGDLPKYAS